jgi:TPR repeat protein
MAALRFIMLLVVAVASHAADIGGWMEQQTRAELQQRDDCTEIIAIAARAAQAHATQRGAEDNALAAASYYASGMCYLVSDKVARDTVAAGAWLARAAELDHPLARRALLALREPPPAPHPAAYHCHDLGLGRKLCHGGAVAP